MEKLKLQILKYIADGYYFGAWKTTQGIFAGRSNGLIYFTPTVKGEYTTVEESMEKNDPQYSEEWKDKIYFTDSDEYDGFEEVETK